jgi:TonB family protein
MAYLFRGECQGIHTALEPKTFELQGLLMHKRLISNPPLIAFVLSIVICSTLSPTCAQVAQGPKLISKPSLNFPSAAYMGRVAGTVWLKVLIGEDGTPIKTDIERRDPEMAYLFDDEARKWAMACRYEPALDESGAPVAVWQVIPLSFRFSDFTPPECIRQAEPAYPEEALAMGIEGWVGLAVLIRANGEVDISQVLVVAREPANTTIFEKAAKAAAYHSKYRPAGIAANAVEGWCFIKVPFRIIPRQHKADQEDQ